MKEKIEKILTEVWEDNNSLESEGSKETIKKALEELSTLIQAERRDAVGGFLMNVMKKYTYEVRLSDLEYDFIEYLESEGKE